jgi:branched-chain amino acid transport system substrate-binding protein
MVNGEKLKDDGSNKKRLIIGGIVVFIFILAGGVYFVSNIIEEESGVMKIVVSAPVRETTGTNVINGIKLALSEVGYVVGDYQIELIIEDDGDDNGVWVEEKERDIAERASADGDVMVYLGPVNSGASKLSIPINNLNGLVQIGFASTWPGLTQPGFKQGEPGIFYPTGIRNYFRVVPTDALQGPAGALWAKDLGVENVYIFDNGYDYGVGIASLFEEISTEIGLNVVGRQTLDGTKEDFTEELAPLKDLDIDLIYFGGTNPTGGPYIAKGIEELELDAKFMGPDGMMNQDLIVESRGAAEGMYLTTVGVSAKKLSELTVKGGEFYENYWNEYGVEPGTFSAFSYEATKVALLAIERAGVKDRARILEEISKIKDYDGLFGIWSFDQNGDTTLSTISGNRVQGGEFVFERLEESNVYEIRSEIGLLK